MRRDTQDEGTQYSGSDSSFVTPAQREQDDRLREARTYLEEQDIWIGRSFGDVGPWTGREVELANLLRAHESKS